MAAVVQVTVSAKGATSLRRGHPWCYRTEVVKAPADIPGGAVVEVVDAQRNVVGQAWWATTSPIALRLLTRQATAEVTCDEAFLTARFKASVERRASLKGRDAFRVVHGEADGLPGVFVDKYNEAVVVQSLSHGADTREAWWGPLVASLCGARVVVSRDDGSGRDFEGLPRRKGVLWGTGETVARYHEGPAVLELDLLTDAKTGSFLDQVDNHLRAGELGRGEALDTFSYHGGFALALSRSCTSVIAVEQDAGAAERAKNNARANGRENLQVMHDNAFDVLRRFAA
ncbi:MAG: RsmD family RNA methyltransferase, partial [Archangium sp.]|nr:RsmD family RNA methyltransferase [Archangium sp.]